MYLSTLDFYTLNAATALLGRLLKTYTLHLLANVLVLDVSQYRRHHTPQEYKAQRIYVCACSKILGVRNIQSSVPHVQEKAYMPSSLPFLFDPTPGNLEGRQPAEMMPCKRGVQLSTHKESTENHMHKTLFPAMTEILACPWIDSTRNATAHIDSHRIDPGIIHAEVK